MNRFPNIVNLYRSGHELTGQMVEIMLKAGAGWHGGGGMLNTIKRVKVIFRDFCFNCAQAQLCPCYVTYSYCCMTSWT